MVSNGEIPFLISAFLEICTGLPTTIAISFVSLTLGALIGLGIAWVQVSRAPILYPFSVVYVSFIRGTPLLVQLYLVYFGLPIFFQIVVTTLHLSLNVGAVPPIVYAFVAFALNSGAFLAVSFRSAIESINYGQFEAAKSIGMTKLQGIVYIVLPQAFRNAIPMIGNTVLGNVKGTSLAFSILVMEMTAQTIVVASRGFRYAESYLLLSLIYFILCKFIAKGFSFAEKKLSVY